MYKVSLKYLLSPWIKNAPKKNIANLSINSKTAIKGDLFIAILGAEKDGRDFVSEAIQKKVSAILYETKNIKQHGMCNYINDIPILYFFKLSQHVSILAGRFYQEPGEKINVIGVTGTNGKTTVTQIINQWSEILGKKTATIGTLGAGFCDNLQETKNTTPSPIYIQSFLDMALKKNIKLVTIEVSSHGLSQHRVKGIPFGIAIFTNISQDHLDYHKNIKKYELAKWLLFSKHKVKKIILNTNDKYGKIWLKKLFQYYTVSVTIKDVEQRKYSTKWINATQINYYKNSIDIKFESSWGKGSLSSFLIGKFNVMNLLLALAGLLELGYNFSDLIHNSKKIRPIKGRMQTFLINNKPIFIIDYAHTPEALKQALISIQLHFPKKYIWCIFGCGGERDKKKRPLMGQIAEKIANRVIITNDNPRNEKEIDIVNDILRGFQKKQKALIIFNRKKAIHYAFSKSKPNHIIFIAGKGHEKQQIIKNKYINYSDKNIVKNLLETKA